MGMNGNEGGSAYPSNPDVKSGSCLIAGFHALTDIRPSYWNAYKAESGATFSIERDGSRYSKPPRRRQNALEGSKRWKPRRYAWKRP